MHSNCINGWGRGMLRCLFPGTTSSNLLPALLPTSVLRILMLEIAAFCYNSVIFQSFCFYGLQSTATASFVLSEFSVSRQYIAAHFEL